MGEAKRRGTFEERKELAIVRDDELLEKRKRQWILERELLMRRPSPKMIRIVSYNEMILNPRMILNEPFRLK